jgi:restriction endonuclease S subunit
MKIRIKDISDVQMGYSFRSRLEIKADGQLLVIQMKDLGDDNRVDLSNVQKIDIDSFDDKHFVKKGDLIFRSRGMTNTAAILDTETNVAIVAAPLLRIRVDNTKVLPEYLCWFINQRSSRQYFAVRREGTHGGMISRRTLENLPLELPALELQKKIVELMLLHERRQILEKKRLDMREQKMNALLLKLINEEK